MIKRDPGGQPGNRNAAKPEYLKARRCGMFRLPSWLIDWLGEQPGSMGKTVEKAIVEYYQIEPPERNE